MAEDRAGIKLNIQMVDLRSVSHIDPLYSWGRYLYWAELKKRDWDVFMTEKGGPIESIPEWLGVSCYWGASLYVAIEGWERAKFQDPVIDALLGVADYKCTLRRLRNGTFHYQPELISPKITEFLRSPHGTLWLYFIHEEFCRWLRDCIETMEQSAQVSSEASQKWRDHCAELIGWLPLRPADEQLAELRKLVDETTKELDASGDDSEAAKELRFSSFAVYDTAVRQTAEKVREYRRRLLAKFGLNPDTYIP